MRKILRRRPGFESLESMTFLSGLAGPVVPHAPPVTVQMSGSIHGTIAPEAMTLTSGFSSFKVWHKVFTGSGSINPLGHVSIKGYWTLPNFFPLRGKHGSGTLSLAGAQTATGFAGTYMLDYAGETGSGNFQITRTGPHGKFTMTFS